MHGRGRGGTARGADPFHRSGGREESTRRTERSLCRAAMTAGSRLRIQQRPWAGQHTVGEVPSRLSVHLHARSLPRVALGTGEGEGEAVGAGPGVGVDALSEPHLVLLFLLLVHLPAAAEAGGEGPQPPAPSLLPLAPALPRRVPPVVRAGQAGRRGRSRARELSRVWRGRGKAGRRRGGRRRGRGQKVLALLRAARRRSPREVGRPSGRDVTSGGATHARRWTGTSGSVRR